MSHSKDNKCIFLAIQVGYKHMNKIDITMRTMKNTPGTILFRFISLTYLLI